MLKVMEGFNTRRLLGNRVMVAADAFRRGILAFWRDYV